MSSPVTDLLTAYYSEELADQQGVLRDGLAHARPDARENLRADFRDLLVTRRMSAQEFWKATSAWFDNDDQLYAALEDAYRYFFDEEPPAPSLKN